MPVLCWVSSTVSSMRRSTRRGTRQSRRPMNRTRTFRSCSSSRRRTSNDSLNPIRKRTSSRGRRQFSVENAHAVNQLTPSSSAPSTVSNSAASPAAWPSVRGRPRRWAQRPLPSITQAMWVGMRRGSMPSGITWANYPLGVGVAGGRPAVGPGAGGSPMVSHLLHSLAAVPVEVVTTPYSRPALEALRRAVAQAKDGDALAPVTVVVPSNHVGVTARRLLAAGELGPVAPGGAGVAAVTFLTVYRLAELLGASALAAEGRRPVSTPVIAAAVRRALAEEPGMFAPVAAHPATERALVASFAELSDLADDALDALAAASPRARSVVGVSGRARAALAAGWYDESELTAAAVARVATDGDRLAGELGRLVVHLPQDLLRRQAELLAALAAHVPTTVVVGVTGRGDADAGVARSLQRMGVPLPDALRRAREGLDGTPVDATAPPLPVSVEGTRVVTASDADDEVRAAIRRVVDAVRDGTPLERIAVLYGSPTPY